MDALTALTSRRSIRAYEPRPVARAIIEQIVDAGRLAASGRNVQPWIFLAVTKRATLDALADISDYAAFLKEAPACILVFGERDAKYYLEDGSAATQNMLVAARALGLGTCWIAGDKKPYVEKIRALLAVPEKYTLVAYLALGYPRGAHPDPPGKQPLSDLLHWERYNS
jgi:nitroreductase